jgi:hypothetical protein
MACAAARQGLSALDNERTPNTMREHTVLYDAEAEARSNRVCGDCQLCCKLLAVRSIGKPNWQKCAAQKVHKGCKVYHRKDLMPAECQIWSCRWLTGMDTEGMRRPDHVHYVIDPMPDMIQTVDSETGVATDRMVLQVWQDPAFPHAHRDPALRAYIERVAERDHMTTIVRSGLDNVTIIVAPCMADDRRWHEQAIIVRPEGGNRLVEMLRAGAGQ